jgi:hypothetical protein
LLTSLSLAIERKSDVQLDGSRVSGVESIACFVPDDWTMFFHPFICDLVWFRNIRSCGMSKIGGGGGSGFSMKTVLYFRCLMRFCSSRDRLVIKTLGNKITKKTLNRILFVYYFRCCYIVY